MIVFQCEICPSRQRARLVPVSGLHPSRMVFLCDECLEGYRENALHRRNVDEWRQRRELEMRALQALIARE